MTRSQRPPVSDPEAFRAWLEARSEGLRERIYAVVQLVPAGRVTTYGDVGRVLGTHGLARQVGYALAALGERSEEVPWQRVINRHGTISHRGELGRALEQRSRLEAEGVSFDAQGRCDLESLRWDYPGLLADDQIPPAGSGS
jgi:methylated-DNA-protein-cysteine methyltransferase-like protein